MTLLDKFNTKRPYSPEGQIIEVYLVEEINDWAGQHYVVEFHDLTRHIKGQTMVFNGLQNIEREVMEAYDRNTYKLI